MGRENLRTGFCPGHAGIPLESRERRPDIGVGALGVFESCEKTARAEFRQLELPRSRGSPSAGLGGIEDYGEKVFEFRLQKAHLISAKSRQENQSGGLSRDLLFQMARLLGGELPGFHSDISEDDDIESGEQFRIGELFKIVRTTAPGLNVRVKEEAAYIDPGVTFESISQVAVFPSRKALDEKHLEFLFPDCDRCSDGVIRGVPLFVIRGKGECELKVADRFRSPENGVLNSSHRRDRDFARDRLALACFDFESGCIVPGERAREREGESDRFSGDAEGGHIKCRYREIRKAGFASNGHGEDRDSTHPEFCGGSRRWLPGIPVSVRDKDDASQSRIPLQHIVEFRAQVCSSISVLDRSGEAFHDDFEGLIKSGPRFLRSQLDGSVLAGDSRRVRRFTLANVFCFHAAGIVPQHRNDRLPVRFECLAPFRLIQGENDAGDDKDSQQFEESAGSRVVTSFPDEESETDRRK